MNSIVHEMRIDRPVLSWDRQLTGAAKVSLRCDRCHRVFPISPMFNGCPDCRAEGLLSVPEVIYSFDGHVDPFAPLARGIYASGSTERYKNLLPVQVCENVISRGEGGTPLVRLPRLSDRLGLSNLFFKCESANPTSSFKDRYVSVTVNLAAHFGYKRAVVASTGNLGVSAAAYCSAVGIKCIVLMSDDAPDVMADAASNHGAIVVKSPKNIRPELLDHLVLHHDCFPIALRIDRPVNNPFGIEGYKTIAFEIIDSIGEVDAVVFPSARGNGLYGTWKGFLEAQKFGRIGRLPAVVATQPVGANSLEVSVESNAKEPVELPSTTSVAFSTCETISDIKALEAIRASKGTAVSATENEILRATHDLYLEGLNIETSSALPLAGIEKVRTKLGLAAGAKIVCVLTASGRSGIDRSLLRSKKNTYVASSVKELGAVIAAVNS